jgi:hypothetical protein
MTMAVGSNPAPVYAIQTKRVDHVERFYENKTNGMTVPGSGPTISKFLRLAAVPSQLKFSLRLAAVPSRSKILN